MIKLKHTISLLILCFFTEIVHAQSSGYTPQAEDRYKYLPELMIKDSLFLQGIESLIFNSFCPQIKKGEYRIFNIYSQKRENYFDLIFMLTPEFGENRRITFDGCFEYKDYLFIWSGPVPEYLCTVSDNKKKLSYAEDVSRGMTDPGTFSLSYSYGKMVLTGICCFK